MAFDFAQAERGWHAGRMEKGPGIAPRAFLWHCRKDKAGPVPGGQAPPVPDPT